MRAFDANNGFWTGRLRAHLHPIDVVAAFLLWFTTLAASAAGANAPVITIPFEMVHGTVIVQATVDGRGPFAMLFDTGADPSIIDLETARSIGLKVAGTGEQGSGSGTSVNLAYATKVHAVSIGLLQAGRIDVLALDLSGLSKKLGQPIGGVLGRSLMRGRVFQIDYPKQVVRFFAVSPLHAGKSAPDTAQRTTLRYQYRDDILLSGVKVNGRPALANLDTGSDSVFQIAPKAVRMLGLDADESRASASQSTGFNGTAQNRTGQVDKVAVGSIIVDHPTVVFASKGTGRDEVAWSIRIGNGFLKEFVVTVDDRSRIVRLERS